MVKKSNKNRQGTRSKAADYDDVVSRIQNVGDLELLIKALAYGRSGTGKTTFACHVLPRPLLLIDLREEGFDSVSDLEDVKIVKAHTWEDLENLYWYLENGDHPFKSWVIDTVTQAQALAYKHVLAEEGKDFISLPIRGKGNELMNTLFMNFRDLPLNGFFLAQDRVDEVNTEEEDQIMPEVGPQISPSVAKNLNAMVKLIFHTYIQEVITRKDGKINRKMEYRIRTGPHPYYLTKVRKPKNKSVPEFIKDPDTDDIIGLMRGNYDPDKKRSSPKPGPAKKAKKPVRK